MNDNGLQNLFSVQSACSMFLYLWFNLTCYNPNTPPFAVNYTYKFF